MNRISRRKFCESGLKLAGLAGLGGPRMNGDDPAEAEFNFGLVRMDKTPKPSYRALKTMTSLVRDLPPPDFRPGDIRFGKAEIYRVPELGARALRHYAASQFSTLSLGIPAKWRTFPVTTVRPCRIAIAAI